MNICFFTSQHVSKLRGGVERVTSILAEIFKSKEYNVVLLSSSKPIDGDLLTKNQFILPNETINSNENRVFLKSFTEKYRIDIIINQSEVKAILELIKSSTPVTPVISVIHTDPAATIKAIQDNWDLWKIKYGTVKFMLLSPYLYLRRQYQVYTRKKYIETKHLYYYNQSNAVVLLSEKFFDSFKNLSGITDTNKLFSISNPSTVNIQQDTVTEKENIVLFVGRLVFQKRLDRLFKIWNRIKDKKDWKLIIIGDGPDRHMYEELCKKWKVDNIEFVGHCDPTPYYKRAKVLCMTSSYEGYGMVITEGLQYSVIPIVFNSYESATDIIENNYNGFLIEPFNLKKFSKTLDTLISDAEQQKSIRSSINKMTQKRDLHSKTTFEKWEDLFKELLTS